MKQISIKRKLTPEQKEFQKAAKKFQKSCKKALKEIQKRMRNRNDTNIDERKEDSEE